MCNGKPPPNVGLRYLSYATALSSSSAKSSSTRVTHTAEDHSPIRISSSSSGEKEKGNLMHSPAPLKSHKSSCKWALEKAVATSAIVCRKFFVPSLTLSNQGQGTIEQEPADQSRVEPADESKIEPGLGDQSKIEPGLGDQSKIEQGLGDQSKIESGLGDQSKIEQGLGDQSKIEPGLGDQHGRGAVAGEDRWWRVDDIQPDNCNVTVNGHLLELIRKLLVPCPCCRLGPSNATVHEVIL